MALYIIVQIVHKFVVYIIMSNIIATKEQIESIQGKNSTITMKTKELK